MRTLRKVAEFLFGDIHLVEKDFAGVQRDAAEQRVAHGAGLLENFLLHEMLVAALFRHDGVPGDVLDRALHGLAIDIRDADALRREDSDIAIGEEENVARVIENGGNIAGDEIFAFAEADRPTGGPKRAATILFGSLAERMASA